MISVRCRLFILFFENNSDLDVMSSVIKLIMHVVFRQKLTGIIESGRAEKAETKSVISENKYQ